MKKIIGNVKTVGQKVMQDVNKILVVMVVILSFAVVYQWDQNQSLWNKLLIAQGGTTNTNTLAAVAATATPSTTAAGTVTPVTSKDHIRGSLDAPLKLVVYNDLECPFCKQFHSTLQQIQQAYGTKVAWVYRHTPLSFHANAEKEAEASECIAELGGNDKFWTYVDDISDRTTSNGTGFALDKLAPLATEVGVDQTAFNTCLNSGKYAQHIQDDVASGSAAGVNGTPGTVAIKKDGTSRFISGALPLAQMKTIIDGLLN